MKIENVPFTVTDWARIFPTEHPGALGSSFWKMVETGNVRLRIVEYSPAFTSDHSCPRGHVMLVLAGELLVKLADGSEHMLLPGMSFHASDDEKNPHVVSSPRGARVFIVD